MKLHVLGCNGPYPCSNCATSGYLLQAGEQFYLLDCGAGVFSRLTAIIDPASLQAVFLTHLHYDHISDIGIFNYYLASRGKTTDLYIPNDTHNEVFQQIISLSNFHVNVFRQTQTVGNIRADTISTVHPAMNKAIKVSYNEKSFIYTGDTAETSQLELFAKNTDVLLMDAAFTEENKPANAPHASGAEAAKLAKKSNIRTLILTHFSPTAIPKYILDEASVIFPNTLLAEEGLSVEL